MSTEPLFLLVLIAIVLANVQLEFIARWRNPPIGEFLDIDGVRLHFTMNGDPDAPPLVMFHGNGTFLQDFTISGLVDAAAHKFRVICFDRPGFGHSSRPRTVIWSPEHQAELFCAELTRLGIERTLVLGHSWGTLVALAMAARNSERVKGLVLVSGYYFPTWRFDVWFASAAALPVIGDALRYTISPISSWLGLPLFAKKTFAPKPVPEIVKKEYPRLMLSVRASCARWPRTLLSCSRPPQRSRCHPSDQMPERDHRRTRRRDRRQRTGSQAAEGDAARRRHARAGGRSHGALFCAGRDCEDRGSGAG